MKNFTKLFKTLIAQPTFWLCVAIFFFIGPYFTISNMMLIPFLTALILKNGGIKTLQFDFKFLLIFSAIWIIGAVSLLYTDDIESGTKMLNRRLPLLVFGILYASFPKQKYHLTWIGYSLISGVLFWIGWSLMHQIPLHLEHPKMGYLFNDNLVHGLRKQAVYMAFYANLALAFAWNTLIVKKRYVALLFILALFGCQVLLASRLALVTTILISGMAVFTFVKNQFSSKLASILVVSVALLSIVVFLKVPAIKNRFESITNTSYQFDNPNPLNHYNADSKHTNWNSLNSRLAFWHCAWDKIKEEPITGYGIGDAQNVLYQEYESKNFLLAIKTNFNTHNQYLDLWLSSGIIGLLILILWIALPLFWSIQQNAYLVFLLFSIIGLALITENMLTRNQGIFIISLVGGMAYRQLWLINKQKSNLDS